MHWLWVHSGLQSGNSAWYLFPSGIGSIIIPPILTGLTVLVGLWWHNQCHVHHCYRYARRTTAAGDRACRKHHPDKPLTAESLRQRHHLYLGSKPGRG